MNHKKSASNLVWLDLEMTGLDHNTNVIIEIATIVTNKNLEIIARGPMLAIYQPEAKLALMDDWCIKTHTNSGLVNRVRESKVSVEEAEMLTLEFIKQWIPERQSPLCGNSIGTDRRFMHKYMPKLENYFHYRIIDVSTIKELALRWRPDIKAYAKRNSHLALEDIEDSIEELKYYIGNFLIKNKPENFESELEESAVVMPAITINSEDKGLNKPWAITQEWVDDLIKRKLPDRPKDSYKHQFGHVVVIGGSRNMAGAIIMAGTAALRVGAGLVTLVADHAHNVWLNQTHPEMMVVSSDNKVAIEALLLKASVVILGPGLGTDVTAKEIFDFSINCLERILENNENTKKLKAIIIDADGLRLLAESYNEKIKVLNGLSDGLSDILKDKLILTPHAGEAEALLAPLTDDNLPHDRLTTVQKISADYKATTVLKGAGSLICKGNNLALCTLGNPGMATAGTGDILSGIIAGLVSQEINTFEASCLGVYLHAKAGDLQAKKYGERGMVATDLLLELRKLLNFV